MKKYGNVYEEVYIILKCLDDEEYKKIPSQVLEIIEKNRNKEYKYIINSDMELEEQEMLPETKAMLFNIFRDYLSTLEQKEKIITMQRKERLKNKRI